MRLQKDSDSIVGHKSWLLLLFPPHFGLVGWLKKGELHPKAVSTSAINMKMTRASFLLSRGNLQDSYLLTNKWTSGPQCIVVHYFMFVFHTKVLEDEKNVR